ncbi:MAG: response regulator [Cyanobacteria bacterium P01_F01_bin.42]
MKVLLVDDDPSSGSFITQALMAENYVVNLVTDGDTALKIAHSCPYELIVLNLLSPPQVGEQLCRILRKNGYQGILMMLSRQGQSEAQLECVRSLQAGADDCFRPSDDLQELITRVQQLVESSAQASLSRSLP